MELNFSREEVILIHGVFETKLKELESLKTSPKCPIDKQSLNNDIASYTSIVDKLLKACPELGNLNEDSCTANIFDSINAAGINICCPQCGAEIYVPLSQSEDTVVCDACHEHVVLTSDHQWQLSMLLSIINSK